VETKKDGSAQAGKKLKRRLKAKKKNKNGGKKKAKFQKAGSLQNRLGSLCEDGKEKNGRKNHRQQKFAEKKQKNAVH